jgi:hypothetical protein
MGIPPEKSFFHPPFGTPGLPSPENSREDESLRFAIFSTKKKLYK